MAVRPENVITHVCKEDNDVAWFLETAIDKELVRWQKEVRNHEPVLIKIGPNITVAVKEIVVERYQEQGWTVEIIQARGGECFRFSPRKDAAAVLENIATAVSERVKAIRESAKTFFKF